MLIYKDSKLDYLITPNLESGAYEFQDAAWYDSNTMYLATSGLGIYKLTINPFKLENIYNEKDGVNNICYSVLVDKEKNIWVGGYGELYKIHNNSLTKYAFKPEDFDDNRVYGIYDENESELFLSFEG